MKHLTDFERQFIAKAAFDWYTQHGFNAELSYWHGDSSYLLHVYVESNDTLPSFPFLDHSDIESKSWLSTPTTTIYRFRIPYGRL